MMFRKFIAVSTLMLSCLCYSLPAAAQDSIYFTLIRQLAANECWGVNIHGNMLYYVLQTGNRGLYAWDITDPEHLESPACYLPTDSLTGEMAYFGRYGVQRAGTWGARMYNLSNSSNITYVSSVVPPGFMSDLVMENEYLYTANRSSGLRIISYRDTIHPIELGHATTSDLAEGIDMMGKYCYIAARYAGLLIYDICIPSSPRLVGTCVLPSLARRVKVAFPYAYVSDSGGGLCIIDVTDPYRPLLVSRATGSYANSPVDASIRRNIAYIADGWNGLTAVNIGDAAHPFGVARSAVVTPLLDVEEYRGYVFACGFNGVYVFRVSEFFTSVNQTAKPVNQFSLSPAYPNPFNRTTRVEVTLPMRGAARVEVYNSTGSRVTTLFDGIAAAGLHRFEWYPDIAAAGQYYCVVSSGSDRQTIPMMYLK